MKKLLTLSIFLLLALALLVGCQGPSDDLPTLPDIEAEESPEAQADKLREYGDKLAESYSGMDVEAVMLVDMPTTRGQLESSTRLHASLRNTTKTASLESDGYLALGESESVSTQAMYFINDKMYLSSTQGADIQQGMSTPMSYDEFCSIMLTTNGISSDIPPSADCTSVTVEKQENGGWLVEYNGVGGDTLLPFIKAAAGFAGFEKYHHFRDVKITVEYNAELLPVTMLAKLAYTNKTARIAPIDIRMEFSFTNSNEAAHGTSLIDKDKYLEIKHLPAAFKLAGKLDEMLLGKEDVVNLALTTKQDKDTVKMNYALVITDIAKLEYELTERQTNKRGKLYIYEDGVLKTGLQTDASISSPVIIDPEEKEANTTAALNKIIEIVQPLPFSVTLISDISEKDGEYTVTLDDSALALLGLSASDSFEGSSINYSFKLVDGEVCNPTIRIVVFYRQNIILELTYSYSFGIDENAPPLKAD